ncbi:MAG: DUF1467 family protein [Alphaproteobacteria bacterium]|nr:DUF1467 family protein [Alphaproteobacteria bacterium]
MNIFSGILVFVCIWWTVIFCVLPFGLNQHEPDPGTKAPGAPENPQILKKILITTAISVILWSITYAIIESGIIDLREMARQEYG